MIALFLRGPRHDGRGSQIRRKTHNNIKVVVPARGSRVQHWKNLVESPSSTILRHRFRVVEYAPWSVTPRWRWGGRTYIHDAYIHRYSSQSPRWLVDDSDRAFVGRSRVVVMKPKPRPLLLRDPVEANESTPSVGEDERHVSEQVELEVRGHKRTLHLFLRPYAWVHRAFAQCSRMR